MLSLILSLATFSPLSYEQFEEKVMDYSISMSRSEEQRNAMRHAERAARTAFLPKVDAEGAYQYTLTNNSIDFGGTDVTLKRYAYSLGVSVMQPVYTGGAVSNAYEAAKLSAQIAEENVRLTRNEMVHRAKTVYWGAVAKTEVYRTVCRYVGIIEQFTATLQAKYDAGATAKTDLLQMQTRLGEAKLQQSAALQSMRQALQAVNVLMGHDPNEPVELDGRLGDATLPLRYYDAEQVVGMRPDFVMASLAVDRQERQVRIAAAEFMPKLSVGLQQQWATPMLNTSGRPKFASAVMATVSMPVFHWGERSKSVASQRAVLRDVTLALHDKYDQIGLEVASALTAIGETRRQTEHARSNTMLAQENLDINTYSYMEGRLTILDVLSAQITWLQAHTNLIQAQLSHRIALADYERAVSAG